MSVNLPNWYAHQYSTNIQLKLQAMGSVLRPYVTEGSYVGDQASPVDFMSSVEMQDVVQRFAPMGRVDAATDRRWVFPVDSDLPQMIDAFDKLRLLTDPESKTVENGVIAAGRRLDKHILNAFFADAKTGVAGAATTSFTSANEVDVAVGGANSRLNVEKLLAVKELMRAKFVDFEREQIYAILTAKDESALLKEIQIISSDFNGDAPVMQDGRITRFLGINFIYCELAETVLAGTNEVTIPVWVKSGMHLGMWNEITTDISQRKDIQGLPWQAYLKLTAGGTRLDEDKVYAIESYRP